MAKNIFTLLEDRQLDVDHGGFGTRTFKLPEWFPGDKVFESDNELIEWCDSNHMTHAVLQAGLAKLVIDCRAKARPSDKKGVKQDWDETAEDRVSEFAPTPYVRPGAGGAKAGARAAHERAKESARVGMELAGMGEDIIQGVLTKMDAEFKR